MTENVALDAVRQSVTVPISQQRAFGLFVRDSMAGEGGWAQLLGLYAVAAHG